MSSQLTHRLSFPVLFGFDAQAPVTVRKTGDAVSLSRRLFAIAHVIVLTMFAFVACMHSTAVFGAEEVTGEARIDFGRVIRPLLAENCFHCHGPDEGSREADLRLDVEEGLFAQIGSEQQMVAAGDPDNSVLFQRLISDDEYERMPPEDSEKELTLDQIDLIRKWIAQGAHWKKHWSFVAPRLPEIPETSLKQWARNSIDHFVLAKLESKGFTPSEQADKATLIRRVTYDLTGLPPTLEEIDAFLEDDSEDAYEKVVDRLIDSAHYGEHMARYWLDAARYGDTHGLHLDNRRTIWPYRDWVINAFNDNMPFDQFTIEQLAGDLLPNATDAQRFATGFNRCNVTTSEGGAIDEEYLAHYAIDRVSTTSTVFMGLTMGCVACHDHKFDPLQAKDFYQLFAFFNSLDGKAMDGNIELPPPVLSVPNPDNLPRIEQLEEKIALVEKEMAREAESSAAEFEAWKKAEEEQTDPKSLVPRSGLVGRWQFEGERDVVINSVPSEPEGTLYGASRVDGYEGRGLETGEGQFADLGPLSGLDVDDPFSIGGWVWIAPGNTGGAVLSKMDDEESHRGFDLFVTGDRAFVHLIHHWPGNAIKLETRQPVAIEKWQHIFVTYDGSQKADGIKLFINGKSLRLVSRVDNLKKSISTGVTFKAGRRTSGSPFHGKVDDVLVYARQLSDQEVEQIAGKNPIRNILKVVESKRNSQQQKVLRDYFLTNLNVNFQELQRRVAKLKTEKKKLESEGVVASLVWKDKPEPTPAYILVRGQYDSPGEQVYRDTPAALPPLKKSDVDGQPTRLDLARWLVSEEHPLTSRVTVNRFWQQYFGKGIVASVDDFGSQGTPPTHPELLDWLAVDFRTHGWNVKRLQRMIVLSATYRQSSHFGADETALDPDNLFYARGPRFRLDAESIRDTALSVSGLLVDTIGGPSVKPYQPEGIWNAVGYTDSNTAKFTRDSGKALYRRSLYTFWKRTAPPPNMVVFDAPSRETCVVSRSRTNTPLAALVLMNDEQFVEAARVFGERIMREGGETVREKATFAFRLATGRFPSADELDVLVQVYEANLTHYQQDPIGADELIRAGESVPSGRLEPTTLAAWTMVSNLVLNLDESVTKG